MKIHALTAFLAACLTGLCPSASAGEQRILMSFDNSGHQVRHIVHTSPSLSLRSTIANARKAPLSRADIGALMSQLQPRMAMIIWKDNEGHLLHRNEVADPRVSHAPAHIQGSNESRLGQNSGAWLISGPDSATAVTILLPADLSLRLGFEQWEVSLERDFDQNSDAK